VRPIFAPNARSTIRRHPCKGAGVGRAKASHVNRQTVRKILFDMEKLAECRCFGRSGELPGDIDVISGSLR
ncbi:hypothetical protein LXJ58_34690, partial [Escherichia coli]|nr:hypothetical protein [Escherichia coli]